MATKNTIEAVNNPSHGQVEDAADRSSALDTTRLDILAAVASQQPYLPVPERLAPGLLLLARAAVMVLGDNSNTNNVNTLTAINNLQNNTSNTGANDDSDSAEDVIVVRLLPASLPKPTATKSSNTTPKKSKKKKPTGATSTSRQRSKAQQAPAPSHEEDNLNPDNPRSTSITTTTNTNTVTNATGDRSSNNEHNNDNDKSRDKDKKCTACLLSCRGKCQVVKAQVYFGACLRCVSRGEAEECSLYEGGRGQGGRKFTEKGMKT